MSAKLTRSALPRLLTACCAFLFVVSCATEKRAVDGAAPREIPFAAEAGRQGHLRFKLQWKDGSNFDCVLNTASPTSIFDLSLEVKLGKGGDHGILQEPTGERVSATRRELPQLYFQGSPVFTLGSAVVANIGLNTAILGVDAFRNERIQLDFTTRKLRFLSDSDLAAADLGNAYQMRVEGGRVTVAQSFLGVSNWVVDTFYGGDAIMKIPDFRPAAKVPESTPFAMQVNGRLGQGAYIATAKFGELGYRDLLLQEMPRDSVNDNTLGLNFLARHIVTFDFPRGVLYLKQIRPDPLEPPVYITAQANCYLEYLRSGGDLPGFTDRATPIFWRVESLPPSSFPAELTLGIHGSWVDLKAKVTAAATAGETIAVGNAFARGDPAEWVRKRLRIDYVYQGSEQTVDAWEGESITLPGGARVVAAVYGNLPEGSASAAMASGGSSAFHYTVRKESKEGRWTLKRAWRTTAETTEELPIH